MAISTFFVAKIALSTLMVQVLCAYIGKYLANEIILRINDNAEIIRQLYVFSTSSGSI